MSLPPPSTNPPGGARPHPRGAIVLATGILSIFLFGIVLGPVAIVMGNNALREIDSAPGTYSNRTTVNAGRILGFVGLALSLLGLVFFLT